MKKILFILLLLSSLQGESQTEIGVQLYSFRNQFKEDVSGTLARISAMGIRFAEGGDSYGLAPAEFRKMLDQHNIKVVSIGADYKELSDDIPAIIEKARLYGAAFVVCFWIPHQGEQLTLEEADAAIRVFNAAGEKLAAAGLRFAYHPHGFEFAKEGKGTIFDRLVAGTDPKFCNFEMDVYWIKQAGQDPLTLLRKYSSRFILMHLKDRKHGTPDSNNGHADVETNVILGQGDVGIAELVKEARKLKMKYLFIEDESSRSMTQVPESLKLLR